MLGNVLLLTGSGVILLWGAAHVAVLTPVVRGFGALSPDNRRIITMEWIAEGLALCFIGILVGLVTLQGQPRAPVSILVIRASALMLLVMAGLSAATGARTSVLPMKLCPLVKTACAALMVSGSAL